MDVLYVVRNVTPIAFTAPLDARVDFATAVWRRPSFACLTRLCACAYAGIRTFHCNRLEEGGGAAPDREFWRSIMVCALITLSRVKAGPLFTSMFRRVAHCSCSMPVIHP